LTKTMMHRASCRRSAAEKLAGTSLLAARGFV
jgi:hypothetical protein